MCVILSAEEARLTEEQVIRAIASNRDGNGFAWIDEGVVHFAKGVSPRTARRLAVTLPLPYVFHARIATVGGVRPELCHPFPLDRRLRPATLRGTSTKGVLFHNGHWSEWRDYVRPAGRGPWSDSRGMAQLVSEFGPDAIDLVVPDHQKVVLLTRQGVTRYGVGWSEVEPGIWASNRHWLYGHSCDPRLSTTRLAIA